MHANPDSYPAADVGFNLVGRSYRGIWRRTMDPNPKRYHSAVQSLLRLRDAIEGKDIRFMAGDYRQLAVPNRSLIYCDPPYKGSTSGFYSTKFDHPAFVEWCLHQQTLGHTLVISEREFPIGEEIDSMRKRIALRRSSDRVKPVYYDKLFLIQPRN